MGAELLRVFAGFIFCASFWVELAMAQGCEEYCSYEFWSGNSSDDIIAAIRESDVSARDDFGQSILHFAAQRGNLESVEVLLGLGADVNLRNRSGLTPLHFGSQFGPLEVVEALVEAGAEVNAVEASYPNRMPIHLAVMRGPLVFDGGAFAINTMTARDGGAEVVTVLLEAGALVDARDTTGNMPIHEAAASGTTGVISILLDHGADLNSLNEIGNTPLHLASRRRNAEVVVFLIEAGANVNVENRDGWTPLHVAASRGGPEVVMALLDAGADGSREVEGSLLSSRQTPFDLARGNELLEGTNAYWALSDARFQ